MSALADVVVALAALLHVDFLVLEMFLRDKPAGLRAFGQTPETAAACSSPGCMARPAASRNIVFVQVLPAALGPLL